MRIVHLSTHDVSGGAAIAAHRLMRGQRAQGGDARMLVRHAHGADPAVAAFNPSMFSWPARLTRRLAQRIASEHRRLLMPASVEIFTDDRSRYGADLARTVTEFDVVHLHWIATFVDYLRFFPRLAPMQRVVWTLHDMAPFTGGCHYSGGCEGFTRQCGGCPQLGSFSPDDPSRRIWTRKNRALSALDSAQVHIVTPSRWLATEARRSSLLSRFNVSVVANGLDTSLFRPGNQPSAREELGVPQNSRTILFVSDALDNPRKGMRLLLSALDQLQGIEGLFLVTVGTGVDALPAHIPHLHLGKVGGAERLVSVYQAADVFVTTALQDNLPNTVAEALSCGTPVVAFAAGGVPEMVEDGVNGALVPPTDVPALVEILSRTLRDAAGSESLSAGARRVAEQRYRVSVQSAHYLKLYEGLRASSG